MMDDEVPPSHGRMWVGPPGTPPSLTDPGTYLGELAEPLRFAAVVSKPWSHPDADPLGDIRRLHAEAKPSWATVMDVAEWQRPVTVTTVLTSREIGDILLRLEGIEPPKRGGTFLYCPWTLKHPGGMTACASTAEGRTLPYSRFRTLSAYRRHWRRWHRP